MKKPRINLKAKLLLFSLVILVIPWSGYHYVRGMERFLRIAQEDALTVKAQAIATLLSSHPALLENRVSDQTLPDSIAHVYLRPLHAPIQLDGYSRDWEDYADRFLELGKQQVIESHREYDPASFRASYAIGSYNHYLYAIFKVRDDRVIYRDPTSSQWNNCDNLQIALQTPAGTFLRYFLGTTAPGWIHAQLLSNDPEHPVIVKSDNRIRGEWQETADGYTLEVRIPLSMIGNKIAFALGDVDDPVSRQVKTMIGTSRIDRSETLATIMVPSAKLEKLLHGLESDATRIWVIDRQRRVLALTGQLHTNQNTRSTDPGQETSESLLTALYRQILTQPVREFEDELSGASKLYGREIDSAISGKPAISWRLTPDQSIAVGTAAAPIRSDNTILGAVMIEQTGNRILLLQNRAMEELINVSLLIFLGVTILILAFATRLTSRVRSLRNRAEAAIGQDGRMTGSFQPSRASDEIGDLSRSFGDLLKRLGQYNRYLETMSGKLSHELKTPLSVVRSSLDNLEQDRQDLQHNTYIQRAREGLERLHGILTRLSEATRLEQALQSAERERFDICSVVNGCVHGYRIAFPAYTWELDERVSTAMIYGVPDLICQMLDKLVGNAMDFSVQGEPIIVTVKTDDKSAILEITNTGDPLPKEMQDQIFESLVSIRNGRDKEPHLGLGLYIVRLIVEYHNGKIAAMNRDDGKGAIFRVSIPLTKD